MENTEFDVKQHEVVFKNQPHTENTVAKLYT